MEAGDRLPVDDLAAPDHGECVAHWHAPDLRDDLVRFMRMTGFAQPPADEEVDALVAEPRSREDGPELAEIPGLDAGFLAQLTRGALVRRLAGSEHTRGQLPDVATGRVPVLSDQYHPLLVVDRRDGRGTGVPHQLQVDGGAIRQRHP